jgi:transcription antitermination factor NusG
MEEQVLNEQKAPSKEEVMAFLKEQIDVKAVQLQLQSLNADLAEARARELKALQFVAQMTNPTPPADAVPHNLTQEDMDENPELVEQGFKVGDEVLVAKESAPAKRSLKKK